MMLNCHLTVNCNYLTLIGARELLEPSAMPSRPKVKNSSMYTCQKDLAFNHSAGGMHNKTRLKDLDVDLPAYSFRNLTRDASK